VDKSHKYKIVDENNQVMELQRQDKVKDLGVWFDDRLTFREHINEKINKGTSNISLCLHLSYCTKVW